jgi:hypothetical protein
MPRMRGLALAFLLFGCAHSSPPAPPAPAPAANPAPPARTEDVESMDAILRALYDSISGPAGGRDWDRVRSLFAPGARLIPVVPAKPPGTAGSSMTKPVVLSLEEFIEKAGAAVQKEGFYEREIARKVEQYGDIAQVFSTYESRHAAGDPQPFVRGINSIQLHHGGGRWWVVTIFWQDETTAGPLPKEFLP